MLVTVHWYNYFNVSPYFLPVYNPLTFLYTYVYICMRVYIYLTMSYGSLGFPTYFANISGKQLTNCFKLPMMTMSMMTLMLTVLEKTMMTWSETLFLWCIAAKHGTIENIDWRTDRQPECKNHKIQMTTSTWIVSTSSSSMATTRCMRCWNLLSKTT